MKSKQWKEKKSKRMISQEKCLGSKMLGKTAEKAWLIFKLVLNMFFLYGHFPPKMSFYMPSNALSRIYAEGFPTILGLKSSHKVMRLGGHWK